MVVELNDKEKRGSKRQKEATTQNAEGPKTKRVKMRLNVAVDDSRVLGSVPASNKVAGTKGLSRNKNRFTEEVRKRINGVVRARVAIARAKHGASKKYHYKQTPEMAEASNSIKKEDVAITEPKEGPDSHASQRGCQDEGSGPSSSRSIPTRELVAHHGQALRVEAEG